MAGAATLLGSLSFGGFSMELIGAPVIAIAIGMVIAMCLPSLSADGRMKEGVGFTSKKVLQFAVVIPGFSLDLGTILLVGSKSLPVIICTISASLITAFVVMKAMRIHWRTATLIGVGSSICGGSAIAATAPVIGAEEKDIAQAISVIFFFNVLAALIFPTLGHAIGLGTEGFAVFAGTAVNDTSSVTAAAAAAENIYGVDGILSSAVTVKLTRTLAIVPITLVLALFMAKRSKETDGSSYSFRKIFPWFILLFIGASVVTTLVSASGAGLFADAYADSFVPVTKWLAKFFISMAMFAIGLNSNLVELFRKGGKPILLGLLCCVAIMAVSLAVQYLTGTFFSDLD